MCVNQSKMLRNIKNGQLQKQFTTKIFCYYKNNGQKKQFTTTLSITYKMKIMLMKYNAHKKT